MELVDMLREMGCDFIRAMCIRQTHAGRRLQRIYGTVPCRTKRKVTAGEDVYKREVKRG